MTRPPDVVRSLGTAHPLTRLQDSPYLRAAWGGEPAAGTTPPHTPVWFQRQAGRSLPEYRELRGEGSILDAIAQPELAAEITLQPVRRYGVDAAILFSDIVVPVAALGFGIDVAQGTGPVAARPFTSSADLRRLDSFDPHEHTPHVLETVRLLAQELDVPLIGFAGAPFTVASYLIEGQPSRDHGRTKALMHTDPALWHALAARLADIAIASLRAQVLAGASAVQLFDSWAGALTPANYEEFVLPHSRRVFAELDDLAAVGVPRAHFGVGTGELLGMMAAAGCEVLGVDWRVPLGTAWKRAAAGTASAPRALQGNLDPGVCLAGWPAVRPHVDAVLAAGTALPGHIFNLGHGVLPSTDPGVLAEVVAYVHERTSGLTA